MYSKEILKEKLVRTERDQKLVRKSVNRVIARRKAEFAQKAKRAETLSDLPYVNLM